MSEGGVVEGVSTTLRRLLERSMEQERKPVRVTLASPAATVADVSGRRLNLFLYHATRNPHLSNQDLGPGAHPAAFGVPALALDLHYLLTAYGDSDDDPFASLPAQHVLEEAMRTLHASPVLDPRDPALRDLVDPGLLGLPEPIRIYLESPDLQAVSSVWQGLATSQRLSASYRVQVALLDRRVPRPVPRLVGEPPRAGPRITVGAGGLPELREVRVMRARDADGAPRSPAVARLGDSLVLLGRGFGPDARVRIDGTQAVAAAVARATPTRVEVRLDEGMALAPGPHLVAVLCAGQPGLSSNAVPFLVAPRVDTVAVEGGHLVVQGGQLQADGADTQLILGTQEVPRDDLVEARPGRLRARLPTRLHGRVAVRVRVGGAEALEAPEVTLP